MTGHSWDPRRYLTYADERGRPFLDLLARIGATAPRSVVDLGCGPGNLTALLAERWPAASVIGVDSSPEMIEAARAGGLPVRFELGDVRDWALGKGRPDTPASGGSGFSRGDGVDVLVSNATLQWVPGHLDLLPDLVRRVAPGGWFALQVPGNFGEPSHTLRTELAAEPPYAEHLGDVAVPSAYDAATYLRVLQGLGCTVDAWETTYLHVLYGDDPVFAWVSGTGARPTLQALEAVSPALRQEFERELKRRLRSAYPPAPDGGYGVVLPFRRVFAVAMVGAGPDAATDRVT